MHNFAAAVAVYRARAASAFRLVRSEPSTPLGNTASTFAPYNRPTIPGLHAFLAGAAAKYAAFKLVGRSHPPPSPAPSSSLTSSKRSACRLGTSPHVVLAVAADVRRARFLVHLSVAQHRFRAAQVGNSYAATSVIALPCGIPPDVRQLFALRHKQQHAAGSRVAAGLTRRLRAGPYHRPANAPPPRLELTPQRAGRFADFSYVSATARAHVAPLPCFDHVVRCVLSIHAGDKGLSLPVHRRPLHNNLHHNHHHNFHAAALPLAPPPPPLDCADSVLRLYAGKPDEMYRRKTSRKFAAWRRRRRDAQRDELRRTTQAEHHMRQTRGHDQLLSHRKDGDSSFAPFMYDLNNGAYAFSSRISEAPKLRKTMIDKYSRLDVDTPGCGDRIERALQAAETTPLFHTRVMNRFG